MDINRLHEKFLTAPEGGYTDTGDLKDLGIPEVNDSLLDNRLKQLARPIMSLENISAITLSNSILEIFFFLDRVTTYFSGLVEFFDFSEAGTKAPPQPEQQGAFPPPPKLPPNPCKQINRIKKLLIKNGYFGHVYIAYGQGYVNEELRVLRLGKAEGRTTLEEANIYPNCKGRLYTIKREYVKNKKGVEEELVTFTSLISGIQGHRFDPKKMVYASFGGQGLFLDGFDLAKEGVAMNKMYVELAKVATTRVKAEVSKPEDGEGEKKQILQWSYYYVQQDEAIMNEITPEVFITPEELKEYMHANMLYISQRMNTLGMVINPTNKAERMTTGEHYKDLKFSSCTESEMLSNLAGMCEDLNKNFNTQLNVMLTSSLQANGAPKTVQNPFQQFQGSFDGSFGGETSNQFSQ